MKYRYFRPLHFLQPFQWLGGHPADRGLMMSLRFFMCLLMTVCLAGCARQAPVPLLPQKQMASSRALAGFSRVTVLGRMNVVLHTGYRKPGIEIKGDPRDTLQVLTMVTDRTLMVRMADSYPKFGPVTVHIKGNYLSSFTYKGAGLVSGSKISSPNLSLFITNPGKTTLAGHYNLNMLEVNGPGTVDLKGVYSTALKIKINGNPKVDLSGVVNISRLDMEGNARLGLAWVKSRHMNIRARGHSVISMAGIVDRLNLELCQYARFNGRHLRVDRVFARTHDHALAEISAVRRQSTLARDASDIYFYEIPEMKTDFMANKGAVLDMRDISPPVVEEYTRYNK